MYQDVCLSKDGRVCPVLSMEEPAYILVPDISHRAKGVLDSSHVCLPVAKSKISGRKGWSWR